MKGGLIGVKRVVRWVGRVRWVYYLPDATRPTRPGLTKVHRPLTSVSLATASNEMSHDVARGPELPTGLPAQTGSEECLPSGPVAFYDLGPDLTVT
jgi:hypothetical protein